MASSSRSSPSTPAFSPRSWSNHVFLSFRGEDIRQRFLGHLYEALVASSIETYMDDKKLPLGGPIATSLIKAIKESQIAVTIFSKNYGDSSWCLNELVCIIECKKKTGLIVVPIFYDVEPTEVRHQTETYGEAFARHESEKDANLVVSWREALKEACGFSGQHFSNTAETYESELIKKIVNQIRKMIQPLTPGPVDDNLVGMEDRMDELISKLKLGSGKIMIGIWGVGGGGKSTLANSVYHRVSGEFDGCCCIENIRENSSKVGVGLHKLQGNILSGVLKKEMKVGSIGEGINMIRDMLSNKKVLIVLDDVDHLDQLEALAESLDWFGDGSRIIITTRDEHLLTAHKVEVHEVRLLNEEEARKLFCKRARLENKPMKEDYTKLSEEVFTYASGLPLALKVLGSSLVGRGMKEWKSALKSLKEIPRDDIVGQLKISYEGLTKVQKDLFLDIACFFRRTYEDDAMEILEACGFNPDIEVNVLREKALITISDGVFDMHDLVQEMGHHIIRGEGAYHNEPEKHSRVWKKEDARKICSMDATTNVDMIEAIRLNIDYDVDFYRNFQEGRPPLVANTKNLRWIKWKGYLAGPLLTKFPPTKLCYLKLSDNYQEQLWEGYKNLPNLKILLLDFMPKLIQTPNFHGIPNLKRFELSYCEYLKEIDSSIGSLKKLDCLSIKLCSRLTMFPSISRLKNLETLCLEGCKSMFFLSEIQQNSGGTEVQNPGEDLVDVDECDFVACFLAHNNWKHIPLCVSSSLQQLTDLRKLNLSNCGLGNGNIGSDIWELPNLQELYLYGNEFSCLDFRRLRLPQLKLLDVSDCYNLVSLSNFPSSIAVIDASRCCSLLKTFGKISDCKWLWKVTLLGSYSLDPCDCKKLLLDMLKGNAIEDHSISVSLPHQIPAGLKDMFFKGKSFTKDVPYVSPMDDTIYAFTIYALSLPDNWYNEFCGLFMRVVTREDSRMAIEISIKQGPDEEGSRFELWQESYKAPEPQYDEQREQGPDEEGSRFEPWQESYEAPEPQYDEQREQGPDEEGSRFEPWQESYEAPEPQYDEQREQGPDEEGSRFELWQESYEAPEPQEQRDNTYVGYVSFGLLRSIASMNSSFNKISFSIECDYCLFAAELVPMNHKDDPLQTTGCSDFWDDDTEERSFRISQHDSKSDIIIRWDHVKNNL